MSVVNRMLQDIDRRREVAGIDVHGTTSDIRSVTAPPRRVVRPGRGVWIAALIIGACAVAAIAWREWSARALLPAAPQTIHALQTPATARGASVTAAPPPAPAATPIAPPSAPAVEPAAVAAAPIESPAASPPAANLPSPRNAAPVSAETLKLSLQLSALVAETPSARVPSRSAPPPPAPLPAPAPGVTTITNVPVRQVAADETVMTARALWNDGSRTAALATLREALVAAEAARNDRAAAALARELARLEVANNRAQSALDLLKRLENLLGEDADAWALRGNAEQRLGMHAEAARSYLAALRTRPTEGKWMLGAAISLAAVGKLDEAQTWVQRARERDAVTPAIAAYLQQLGIAARR